MQPHSCGRTNLCSAARRGTQPSGMRRTPRRKIPAGEISTAIRNAVKACRFGVGETHRGNYLPKRRAMPAPNCKQLFTLLKGDATELPRVPVAPQRHCCHWRPSSRWHPAGGWPEHRRTRDGPACDITDRARARTRTSAAPRNSPKTATRRPRSLRRRRSSVERSSARGWSRRISRRRQGPADNNATA
jgi:hypothetical protein